jgi:hypothetical protein
MYLVHLEQCPLPHLLQRADLARLLLPGQEHLAISTLADLSDDVELVDSELSPPPTQEYAFATTV